MQHRAIKSIPSLAWVAVAAIMLALALPGSAFAADGLAAGTVGSQATSDTAGTIDNSQTADDGMIHPSGDTSGTTDGRAINAALSQGGTVTLAPGTYYTRYNLKASSNTAINAAGATIYGVGAAHGGIRNDVISGHYNYDSITNFTINGGTWTHVNPNGSGHSMIQFTHGSNIAINNATIIETYTQHALEFIACNDVRISGCTVESVGAFKATTHEDAIQLDIASPKTAPSIKRNFGAAAVAGQTCQNITIDNCNVTGSRGIATNYTKDKKYSGNTHKNISITNSTITGMSAEGVALFNVTGKVVVQNNTIVSNCKKKNNAYSVGLHFAAFGKYSKASKKAAKKTKVTVQGNTIKGGRQGIFVCSHTSNKIKMGKYTVTKNNVFCKKGKKNAIGKSSVTKFKAKKNKLKKW